MQWAESSKAVAVKVIVLNSIELYLFSIKGRKDGSNHFLNDQKRIQSTLDKMGIGILPPRYQAFIHIWVQVYDSMSL